MATALSKLRIFLTLWDRLEVGDYPSKEELIDDVLTKLEEHIAPRTFDRYRQEFRDEFGLEIRYNSAKNGYEQHRPDDEVSDLDLRELIGLSQRMGILFGNLKRKTRYLRYETREDYAGLKYVDFFLHACEKGLEVKIEYGKFQSVRIDHYIIEPIVVKEYQNRWYVIAYVPDKKGKRTFGLERIRNAEHTGRTFEDRNLRDKILSDFDAMVGLDDRHRKVEEVHVRFYGIGVKYEETLPIHHSARVVDQSSDYTTYAYTIIPNFEFTQRILSQADRVEVLKPAWLRNEIRGYLEGSRKRYV